MHAFRHFFLVANRNKIIKTVTKENDCARESERMMERKKDIWLNHFVKFFNFPKYVVQNKAREYVIEKYQAEQHSQINNIRVSVWGEKGTLTNTPIHL